MLNAKQMVAIAIVTMAISSGTTVIANQNIGVDGVEEDVVKLEGSIVAKIYGGFLGLASPSINLSNSQILEFNTTKIGDDTYCVDSVLKIDIDVVGNVSRRYLPGRYLVIRISIRREEKHILPLRGLLQRWFIGRPLIVRRINVVRSGEKYVEIPLRYETSCVSENASMYIFARGTPIRLLVRGFPVFAFKKIDLELVYRKSDHFEDTIPPVTICELKRGNFWSDKT